MKNTIKFARNDAAKFFKTLNKRVNTYFKDNKIKKTGNWQLYIKAGIMFALYLVPYVLMLTMVMPNWVKLLLVVIMGVGMAGIGMNVMHDGNHGSFSSKKWINTLMGGSIYILAGNVYNWQVQHNVLHHTYTNIHGHDEDMEAGRVLRFSPFVAFSRFWHSYQHYHAWFFYGLLTLNWALTTDFFQSKRYLARGLSYGKMPTKSHQWTTVWVSKIIYWTMWIILPLLLIENPWWQILFGFFIMHFVSGIILSVIFQLAHMVEEAHMPLPDETGTMKNTWAIHQLFTTVNFARKNRVMNWFSGGLNHQIEHHIFPHISHIHYTKISSIVKKTALEFNLPYNEYDSTRKAISAHYHHLRKMAYKPKLKTV